MTLKEFIEINALSINKVVVASGASSEAVKAAIEKNITKSKKLKSWCILQGIELNNPPKVRTYEVSRLSNIEIVDKYIVEDQLPYNLDTILSTYTKQKRTDSNSSTRVC